MRRVGHVLQPLLSQVDELGGNRSPHMPPGIGGDTDSARRGEALPTRWDGDAGAVDVVRCDDHVTKVDAHAELDATALRHRRVAGEHQLLHFERAAHGVDDAAEFGNRAVTSVFYDAAAMLL